MFRGVSVAGENLERRGKHLKAREKKESIGRFCQRTRSINPDTIRLSSILLFQSEKKISILKKNSKMATRIDCTPVQIPACIQVKKSIETGSDDDSSV